MRSEACHLRSEIRTLFSVFVGSLATLVPLTLPAAPGGREASPSPHAQVQPVPLGEVHWTQGFWADRFDTCRRSTLPALWSIMGGTNYSQFYRNFRIAAGLAEGRHRGASFNDGDFYKWIEGASAVLAATTDNELAQRLDEVIGVIAKAQRADGYLHTPGLIHERNGEAIPAPFQDPLQFEFYNLGHLMSAGCVYARVTGRTNLLAVACKAADFIDTTVSRNPELLRRSAICPAHYMGLVDLYRSTHQPRYLELAKRLFASRDLVADGSDDNQDRLPFPEQTNAVGHAVRANYLYAGAADLYLETGDQSRWQPLLRLWTNVVCEKMYLTGGCGALYDGASPDGAKDQKSITRIHQAYGRDYQLPNLTAHNETCANIGNVLWNWRMFLATGQARFMDVAELALYNSVLSGVDLSGTNFAYVNPLRSFDPPPLPLRWSHRRSPFLSSFCCPPNLFRTVAETAGYAYARSGDTLWVNLYSGSRVTTTLPAGQNLTLLQETDYPWNGRVRLTVESCCPEPFAIRLRIPGWAKSARLRLNDLPLDLSPLSASYAEVRRRWQAGDVLDLELPMPPQVLEANPLVEESRNQIALKRGPLVYCLESTDLPPGTRLEEVALPTDSDVVARFDRRLLGGVVLLEGQAQVLPTPEWRNELYREVRPVATKPINVRLVPYFVWGNRGASSMTVWLPRGPL